MGDSGTDTVCSGCSVNALAIICKQLYSEGELDTVFRNNNWLMGHRLH